MLLQTNELTTGWSTKAEATSDKCIEGIIYQAKAPYVRNKKKGLNQW